MNENEITAGSYWIVATFGRSSVFTVRLSLSLVAQ